MQNLLLVYCTCPDRTKAQELANGLVRDRLAACVSIGAPVTSVYAWQGEIQNEQEVPLLIKTSSDRYQELEVAILARHPYELPEIIAVPIQQGLPDYLKWVQQCTSVDN